MGGTKLGGLTAARTNKELFTGDFYRVIGTIGGSVSHPETRAFTINRELARKAGRKGGTISRRGKRRPPQPLTESQRRKLRIAEAYKRLELIHIRAKRLRESEAVV